MQRHWIQRTKVERGRKLLAYGLREEQRLGDACLRTRCRGNIRSID